MSEHSLQCIAEEMKSIVCMGEPEQVYTYVAISITDHTLILTFTRGAEMKMRNILLLPGLYIALCISRSLHAVLESNVQVRMHG